MSKKNIIIISAGAAVVIVGLVLGLTLGGSESGQTPGKKVMADTTAYLMEMKRLLNGRGDLEQPKLCKCCDTPLVDGICPYCQGGCDQSSEGETRRLKLVNSAPVAEVEGGSGDAVDSGSNGCSCTH